MKNSEKNHLGCRKSEQLKNCWISGAGDLLWSWRGWIRDGKFHQLQLGISLELAIIPLTDPCMYGRLMLTLRGFLLMVNGKPYIHTYIHTYIQIRHGIFHDASDSTWIRSIFLCATKNHRNLGSRWLISLQGGAPVRNWFQLLYVSTITH